MFADGAYEIFRQFLSNIFIAAHLAAPNGLVCFLLLRFRLYMAVVIGIGCGWRAGKDSGVFHQCHEHCVRFLVYLIFNSCRNICVRSPGNVGNAVFRAFVIGKIFEFIRAASALKAKMPKQFKIGVFG